MKLWEYVWMDVVILEFLFAQDLPAYSKDRKTNFLASYMWGSLCETLRPKHAVQSRVATALYVHVLQKEMRLKISSIDDEKR